jgi:Uma2 family endonuclease
MSTILSPPRRPAIEYPDSDGQPIADNTLQFEWIVTIKGGLEAVFRHRPDVFVAGDLLWYPVEGRPDIRIAPDALVAIGRPKGYRGSYKQWEEDDVAPQVVFEVLSPGNRAGRMIQKFRFYEKYRVLEYYVYDPETIELSGWQRVGSELQEISEMNGWTSPLLGIRFDLASGELKLYGPDGQPFATYIELVEQREAEHMRAETERERAETERERAETESTRAEAESTRAETERLRAERLAAKLRELGIEPD